MVVDSLEFDFALSGERVWWWCVMGGAQNLPKMMANPSRPPLESSSAANGESNMISNIEYGENQDARRSAAESLKKLDVQHYRKVCKMEYVWTENAKACLTPKVQVWYKDTNPDSATKGQTFEIDDPYDAVFNSTTLAVQQTMNLTGLNLNWGTKQAIRSLGYGASSKVGIRFKTLWWMTKDDNLGIDFSIKGGVGHTDESIGFCVYPSYNVNDKVEKPGVLLASYNWGQAAQRLSTLIDPKSPQNEHTLKEVLLDNLARLHAPPEKYEAMKTFLEDQYLDHYAWDWYHDENSAGAFAFFGPGQFKNMYPW